MTPPNDIVTLLKQAQHIQWISLIGSGYEYPTAPVTREQSALICLSYAIDMARAITQLCEDELYDEVFEIFREKKDPLPW